jgi:hypothetical protein
MSQLEACLRLKLGLPLSAEANAFVAAISTAVVLACVGETFGKLSAAWIE